MGFFLQEVEVKRMNPIAAAYNAHIRWCLLISCYPPDAPGGALLNLGFGGFVTPSPSFLLFLPLLSRKSSSFGRFFLGQILTLMLYLSVEFCPELSYLF